MSRRAHSLLALLCIVPIACSAAAQTPTSVSTEPAPAEGDALVVVRTEDGYVTHWMRPTEAGADALVTRTGAIMAAASTLWRFEQVAVGVELCSCPDFSECAGTASTHITVPKLASLLGTNLLDSPPGPAEELGTLVELDVNANLAAVVGPFVFVDRFTYALGCGAAHGYVAAAADVFDLATPARVDLYTAAERAAFEAEQGPAALAQLRSSGIEQFEEAPRLTRVVPTWDAAGALHVTHQLTFAIDYASSDGAWDSYTTSVELEPPSVPPPLAPYGALPAAVRAYRDAHPELEVVGWTTFDADPSAAAAQAAALLAMP